MKYIVVSVKDRALDAFGRPIFTHTTGQAVRSFQDEINRQSADNEMYRHPDDYDLYLLATFNDETGEFANLGMPEQIAIGKQLSNRKE